MCEEEKEKGITIENNDVLTTKEEEDIKEYFENVVGMTEGKLVVRNPQKD